MSSIIVIDRVFDLDYLSAIEKASVREVEIVSALSFGEWLTLQSYKNKLNEQSGKENELC